MNAISTVGVVYKLSYECDRGKIKNCGCNIDDHHNSLINTKQHPATTLSQNETFSQFYWSRCNHHIRYGLRIAKIFLDPNKNEVIKARRMRSMRYLVSLQNNKAARKVCTF